MLAIPIYLLRLAGLEVAVVLLLVVAEVVGVEVVVFGGVVVVGFVINGPIELLLFLTA